MKIDLQVEVEHKDGKYPSFDLILRSGPGKDPFLIIRGCRIVNGQKGEFISYPSRKTDEGKYWNHVWADMNFNAVVLSAAHATEKKVKQEKPKAADPFNDDSDLPF